MRGFRTNRPLRGKRRGGRRHGRHCNRNLYAPALDAQQGPAARERECKLGGPCIGGGDCANCIKMAEMRRSRTTA